MRIFYLIALVLFSSSIFAQSQDGFLSVVEAELAREVNEFSKAKQPPYYIAYRINDVHSAMFTSSFGSLVVSDTDRSRILVTDVRVGDYTFDNCNRRCRRLFLYRVFGACIRSDERYDVATSHV